MLIPVIYGHGLIVTFYIRPMINHYGRIMVLYDPMLGSLLADTNLPYEHALSNLRVEGWAGISTTKTKSKLVNSQQCPSCPFLTFIPISPTLLISFTLKMERAGTSKTFVPFH